MSPKRYATMKEIEKSGYGDVSDTDLLGSALLSDTDDLEDGDYEDEMDIDDEESSKEPSETSSEDYDERNNFFDSDEFDDYTDEKSIRRTVLYELAEKFEKNRRRKPWQRGVCYCGYMKPSWIRPGAYARASSSIVFETMVDCCRKIFYKEKELHREPRQQYLYMARRICIKLLRGVLADLSILEKFALEINEECADELGKDCPQGYEWKSIFREPGVEGPFLSRAYKDERENEDESESEDQDSDIDQKKPPYVYPHNKASLYPHPSVQYDSDILSDMEYQRLAERGLYPIKTCSGVTRIRGNPTKFKRPPL